MVFIRLSSYGSHFGTLLLLWPLGKRQQQGKGVKRHPGRLVKRRPASGQLEVSLAARNFNNQVCFMRHEAHHARVDTAVLPVDRIPRAGCLNLNSPAVLRTHTRALQTNNYHTRQTRSFFFSPTHCCERWRVDWNRYEGYLPCCLPGIRGLKQRTEGHL